MADKKNNQPEQTVSKPHAVAGRDIGHVGDNIAGDKVAGNKIVNIYMMQGEEATPPQSFEPLMVHIPAGPFLMGRPTGEGVSEFETPQHLVTLPDFLIGRYPITNDEYERFIRANKEHEPPAGWFNRKPLEGFDDHPVCGVTWFDAVAYCDWLFKETKRRYRIPSEAEWEKAASWTADAQKRLYPWGNEWVEGRCNVGGEGMVPVFEYEDFASAFGVVDMLGNVQEWTRSLWGRDTREPQFRYEYDPQDDDREVGNAQDLPARMRIVHRGGSYRSKSEGVSNTRRGRSDPNSKVAWRGFRVVLAVEVST